MGSPYLEAYLGKGLGKGWVRVEKIQIQFKSSLPGPYPGKGQVRGKYVKSRLPAGKASMLTCR
jgi:hypothetical protein